MSIAPFLNLQFPSIPKVSSKLRNEFLPKTGTFSQRLLRFLLEDPKFFIGYRMLLVGSTGGEWVSLG